MVKLARVLIAIMFILSAIAKLLSLEFFDQLVAEFFLGKTYYEHIDSMFYTQLFARVLIVGELVLGMAVLQNHLLKKVVLPSIMGMLVIFTGHLFYVSLQSTFIGGNCGCFGDIIPLDNLESIIKNVVAMLLVALMYFKHTEMQRFDSWVPATVLGLVAFGTLWLTIRDFEKPIVNESPVLVDHTPQQNIVIDTVSENIKDSVLQEDDMVKDTVTVKEENVEERKVEKQNKPSLITPPKAVSTSDFSRLLDKYTSFKGKSNVKLNEGHKLVCFYSLTCSHCQEAYRELYQMDKSGKLPEMYLICYGKEFDKFYFFNQGGGEKPHILLTDKHEFDILMGGESFPKILDMKDGQILKKWDIKTYNKESVASYFNVSIESAIEEPNSNSIVEDEESEVKF